MVKVVVVNKHGQLKESSLKSSERSELYKKAGFKKGDGFEHRTSWSQTLSGTKVEVELWAKEEGKAGSENKYDFPPPVDTTLYFGSCVLLRRDPHDQIPQDLTIDMWTRMYEKLFGGFEDLDDAECSSEDELDGVPEALKTKDGYLKDGFICDDGEPAGTDSDEALEDDVSEDGEENIIMDTLHRSRPRHTPQGSDSEGSECGWEDGYDSSELVPETYTYSDEE
jgi:hypothetical protein